MFNTLKQKKVSVGVLLQNALHYILEYVIEKIRNKLAKLIVIVEATVKIEENEKLGSHQMRWQTYVLNSIHCVRRDDSLQCVKVWTSNNIFRINLILQYVEHLIVYVMVY